MSYLREIASKMIMRERKSLKAYQKFLSGDSQFLEEIRIIRIINNRKQLIFPIFLKIFFKKILSFFIICSVLVSSCSHSLPKHTEINLQKYHLSKVDIIALSVSSSELEVIYEDGSSSFFGAALILAPFLGLLPIIIGLGADGVQASKALSRDQNLADNIREAKSENIIGRYYFEKLLGDAFYRYLESANLFKIKFEQIENYKILWAKGYHAIITLKIEELLLMRTSQLDKLFIYMRVLAKMNDLQNDKVIWEKVEELRSDEEYTLVECKTEGGKIKSSIDKLIDKIAFRLASDIIYSK